MVGLIDIPPFSSVTLREQGTDAIAATAGEVHEAQFGSSMAANLTPRLYRWHQRNAAETDIAADLSAPQALDPKTLNERYGIPGHLSFDQPLSEYSARDLFDHKHAELVRQDVIERRNGGVRTGTLSRMGTGLIAGILDPLNVATALIPILGEVRAASLLGRGAIEAMGAAERIGVRAVAGGVSGGVGMAALQPLEYALSMAERDDFTMADALHNITFGAVLGGGLHVVGGAVADRVTGRYANPITQRIEDAGPEVRREVLQGAVAQHLNDEPVRVAPALDLADALNAERGLNRNVKYEFEKFTTPIEGDMGTGGFIVRRDGVAIAKAAITVEGRNANIEGISTYTEPGVIQVGRGTPNIFGAREMRNMARTYFEANPEIDTMSGLRVTGAREAAADVVVTRDQVMGLRQRQAQAITEMGARPDAISETSIAAEQASRVTETLPDIERQIAEMEAAQGMPPVEGARSTGETPGTFRTAVDINGERTVIEGPTKALERPAELLAADAEVAAAQGRAAAYERAAKCIIGGG